MLSFIRINTLFVTILLMAMFAFAGGRSGARFVATFGSAYLDFTQKSESWDYYRYDGKNGNTLTMEVPGDRYEIEGFGPAVDLRFSDGLGSFDLFLDMQFSHAFGDLNSRTHHIWHDPKDENYKVEVEEDSEEDYVTRLYLGFGFDYLPFRSLESPMHGFFVGLSVGIVSIDGAFYDQGVSASAEIGKMWNMNELFDAGIVCLGTADAPIMYGESVPSDYFYTLWIGARFETK